MNQTMTGSTQTTTQGDLSLFLLRTTEGVSTEKDGATGNSISFLSVLEASMEENKAHGGEMIAQIIASPNGETLESSKNMSQAKNAVQDGTNSGETNILNVFSGKISDDMASAVTEEPKCQNLAMTYQTMMHGNDNSPKQMVSGRILENKSPETFLRSSIVGSGQLNTGRVGISETDNTGSLPLVPNTPSDEIIVTISDLVSSAFSEKVDVSSMGQKPTEENTAVMMSASQIILPDKINQFQMTTSNTKDGEIKNLEEETAHSITDQISSLAIHFMRTAAGQTNAQNQKAAREIAVETEIQLKDKIIDVLVGNESDMDNQLKSEIAEILVLNGFDTKTASSVTMQVSSAVIDYMRNAVRQTEAQDQESIPEITVEMETQFKSGIADVLLSNGFDTKTASSATMQVSSAVIDYMRNAVRQTEAQDQESIPEIRVELETQFKSKISDVLLNNGFDKETADRIADQIKTVTVARETVLPAMNTAAARSPFDHVIPKETDTFGVAVTKEKSPDSSKMAPALAMSADSNPVISDVESPSAFVKTAARNDIKTTEGASFAVTIGKETDGKLEVPYETAMVSNTIREEMLRSDVGRTKQRNIGIELFDTHESVPHWSVLQQASGSSDVAPSLQPVRVQDIIEQVADLRNAQKDPSGRVKIVLDPPNLGTVEMDFVVRGGRVSAVMTAETSEVRQILQSRAEDMKQALTDQGLRIDRIEVKQSEEKSNQQWTNGGREWKQHQDGGYHRQHRERNPQSKFEMSDYLTQLSVMA